MKKYLILIIYFNFSILLISCGNSNSGDSAAGSSIEETSPTDQNPSEKSIRSFWNDEKQVCLDSNNEVKFNTSPVGNDAQCVDFSNKNLKGTDFSNFNLSGVNFKNSVLSGIKLEGATIKGLILEGVEVDSAYLLEWLLTGIKPTDIKKINLDSQDSEANKSPIVTESESTIIITEVSVDDLTQTNLSSEEIPSEQKSTILQEIKQEITINPEEVDKVSLNLNLLQSDLSLAHLKYQRQLQQALTDVIDTKLTEANESIISEELTTSEESIASEETITSDETNPITEETTSVQTNTQIVNEIELADIVKLENLQTELTKETEQIIDQIKVEAQTNETISEQIDSVNLIEESSVTDSQTQPSPTTTPTLSINTLKENIIALTTQIEELKVSKKEVKAVIIEINAKIKPIAEENKQILSEKKELNLKIKTIKSSLTTKAEKQNNPEILELKKQLENLTVKYDTNKNQIQELRNIRSEPKKQFESLNVQIVKLSNERKIYRKQLKEMKLLAAQK